MAYDINIVKQGVYKVPVKVKTASSNFMFLQNVLFGEPSISDNGDSIAYDYGRKGVKLPKEAIKGADPTRVNMGSEFNEKHIFGMYFNDEDQVEVKQAENRVCMDEPLDAPWSVEQRLTYLLAEKRDDIIQSHKLATEKACAETILEGSFETRNGGTQSFPMTSSLLSTSGANLFSAPVKTLTAAAKALLKVSGAKATMLTMNPDDAIKLLQSSEVKDLLDNRRVIGNEAWFKAIDENGASYCGTLMIPGLGNIEVISYFGGYEDSTGYHYYIPQGKAILSPKTVGCLGYCGVYVDNGVVSGKVAMDHGTYIYAPEGALPHAAHVQVQSAPAPVLTAIDRYCVFTNIPNA